MRHTKFQGHRPFGSGEEDFFRFLLYMGMAAILLKWPGPVEQTFVPAPHGGSIWNLTLIGPVVFEEKMFENVDIHTHTHIRGLTEAYLSYKLITRWAKTVDANMTHIFRFIDQFLGNSCCKEFEWMPPRIIMFWMHTWYLLFLFYYAQILFQPSTQFRPTWRWKTP